MKLRELTPADAPRCAALEEVLFPGETPWSSRIFREEMAQPFNFYFGVEGAIEEPEPLELLGYAGIGMMGPAADPEFEIHTIGVDPAAQRIARMMMDNICHIADLKDAPVFLEVRVATIPPLACMSATALPSRIRKNYYQPSGADAHVMVRPRQSERLEDSQED